MPQTARGSRRRWPAEILEAGADVLTLGNHAFHARELLPELDRGRLPIVRPLNFAPGTPGRGFWDLSKEGVSLRVVNLCGRVFMQEYDDPFRTIESVLPNDGQHCFIDFHAEATSEKIAFARHVDGQAAAVIGTHTHVQTNDAQISLGNGLSERCGDVRIPQWSHRHEHSVIFETIFDFSSLPF